MLNDQIGRLVGHRGFPQRYPENTLLGIEAAIAVGAKAIEIDLQISRDGKPVLSHDETLKRATGMKGLVADFDLAVLEKFSAHEPGRFGDAFLPTPMTSLQTLAQALAGHPEVTLFVEIKEEVFKHCSRAEFMARVWSDLEPIRSRCVIISFDADVLDIARRDCHCPIGWVLTHYVSADRLRAQQLQPDYLICNIHKLPRYPAEPWPGPWQWFVYDVVNAEVVRQCFERGITFVESWDIGAVIQTLGASGDGGTVA